MRNLLSLFKDKANSRFIKLILAWIFRFVFKQRLKRINPDEYNGASLIGLKAVVVKSHGSANVNAFAHAIADAAFQARQRLPEKILAGLARY